MATQRKIVKPTQPERRFLILSDAILGGTNGSEEARFEQMTPLKPGDYPTGIDEAVLVKHGCDVEWLLRSQQIEELKFS